MKGLKTYNGNKISLQIEKVGRMHILRIHTKDATKIEAFKKEVDATKLFNKLKREDK